MRTVLPGAISTCPATYQSWADKSRQQKLKKGGSKEEPPWNFCCVEFSASVSDAYCLL